MPESLKGIGEQINKWDRCEPQCERPTNEVQINWVKRIAVVQLLINKKHCFIEIMQINRYAAGILAASYKYDRLAEHFTSVCNWFSSQSVGKFEILFLCVILFYVWSVQYVSICDLLLCYYFVDIRKWCHQWRTIDCWRFDKVRFDLWFCFHSIYRVKLKLCIWFEIKYRIPLTVAERPSRMRRDADGNKLELWNDKNVSWLCFQQRNETD